MLEFRMLTAVQINSDKSQQTSWLLLYSPKYKKYNVVNEDTLTETMLVGRDITFLMFC